MTTSHITLDTPPQSGHSETINASCLRLRLPQPPKKFYRHGWQSWSLAAWTDPIPLPIPRPTILHPLQFDPVYVKEAAPHSSWVAAVEFAENDIVLLGALGLSAHIILQTDMLEGFYESGEGEWLIARGNERSVFEEYAHELGKRFGQRSDRSTPRVWCSWYSLYTAIDEIILHQVFDDLSDLPFDVFQVDDGWQISIGDWEANTKFPSGMNALAEKIKSTGRNAGLWLAPLIAVESSRLFRTHPDWFLRDSDGKFVSAGFNWGEQLFALDTTHPAALEWLAALMQQVRTWGFDYLKLDFLYAGALPGKRNNEMPREEAYRHGLKVMREAMGSDAFFLTCGAPILPSLGLCDAMRVGPDVSGKWEDPRDAILLYNPATPGTRNAIRTTVNRLWLQSLVMTDPDVAYFAEKGNLLSMEQKKLLQDLASICNFKATSDLPEWMTSTERKQLQEFLSVQPGVKQLSRSKFLLNAQVVDFSSAVCLPEPPTGVNKVNAAVLGWLANRTGVLRMFNKIEAMVIRIKLQKSKK